MLILFIRHGRTAWNDQGRIQGRTDIPLSERGAAEQACRQVPAEFLNAHCLSSPLQRAQMTAALLGFPEPEMAPGLIEMNFGAWEGRTYAELIAEDAAAMRAAEKLGRDMRPPGGETPREVGGRLLDALATRPEAQLVAVTHKGVIRAAFALALGWAMTGALPFKVDWAAGQLFRLEAEELTLVQANLALTAA